MCVQTRSYPSLLLKHFVLASLSQYYHLYIIIEHLPSWQAAEIVPNEFVFGTLIGNALRNRSYEYVTSLLKKMRHFEVLPNETIMETLETAASRKPKVTSSFIHVQVFYSDLLWSISLYLSPSPTPPCVCMHYCVPLLYML